MWRRLAVIGASAVVLGSGVCAGLGCARLWVHPSQFDYFGRPDPDDAWSAKIAGWQRRERAEEGPSVEERGDPEDEGVVEGASAEGAEGQVAVVRRSLREKYFDFRAERKRALARQLAEWLQTQAKGHYVADGPIDHWATLEETLRGNGDDCDGLELLSYHALRDLGFLRHEVYRAVVFRPSDGQHHMVTLWFEDRNDPWVLDPTGAMTRGMPRMSELPEWVPLKVFSDTAEYTVRRVPSPPGSTRVAVNP